MGLPLELGLASSNGGAAGPRARFLRRRVNLGVLEGKRVLVAEDETLAALEIADMLKRRGCTVLGPVGSLRAAMVLAEGEALDAAIIDVRLSDGLSYPLARHLMRNFVPFVFATAHARDLSWPDDLRHVPRVAKPYSERALLVALAGALSEDD